jgi:methylmalonyl-CoA/ethylmalonyl-CoA epimerase
MIWLSGSLPINMKIEELKIRFHHVGFACNDINKYKKFFLPFIEDNSGIIFEDKNQNVKVEFINLIGDKKVELIQVLNSELYCPIKKFIDRNISGFHHLCYESNDVNETLLKLKDYNYRLVSKTINGFEGRVVSFVIPKKNPDGPLIEIISKKF